MSLLLGTDRGLMAWRRAEGNMDPVTLESSTVDFKEHGHFCHFGNYLIIVIFERRSLDLSGGISANRDNTA